MSMVIGFAGSRRLCLALLCALLVVSGATLSTPARAASCAAGDVAMKAGEAFVEAAHTQRASDFAAALASYADMDHIALFALGRYRSSLPPQRKAEFISLTSQYVANTLADFALKFRATGIRLIDCRGNQAATRLEFGARPAKRATWRIAGDKVVDVNVQNVWLAQLLRDNYVGILNRSGGDIAILLSNIGAPPAANSN